MSKKRAVDITDQQRKAINGIIDKYKDTQGALIPTLHEVQEYFGYLPVEVQKIISEGLGIPLAEIYGVVTFYTQFSTQPKGKYTVSVCLGTACYVKGSGKILEKFESTLGIKAGEASEDGNVRKSKRAGAWAHAVWLRWLWLTVRYTDVLFRLMFRASATSI